MISSPAPPTLVADVIADALAQRGVTVAFGVMGDDTAGLTVALRTAGIRYVGLRHETSAIAAADGFAWATSGPAVCLVTRGPGLLHALMALRTAQFAGSGVLVISGDVPPMAYPELDRKRTSSVAVAASIGLEHIEVTEVELVLPGLARAFDVAAGGTPAVLTVRNDVLWARASTSTSQLPTPAVLEPVTALAPSEHEIDVLIDLLRESGRPLLLAGRGAIDAAAGLRELARRYGALLGTTTQARGLFLGEPGNVGLVGAYSTEATRARLAGVDAIFAFGARLVPDTTSAGRLFGRAKLVHIDRAQEAIGRYVTPSVGIVADVSKTVDRLIARPLVSKVERASDVDEILPRRVGAVVSAESPVDPEELCIRLDWALPADRVVVLDSGRFMRSAARLLQVQQPRDFRMTVDAGAISLGLGVAIGAAIARPNRYVVLVTGDGGLSMSLGDLISVAAVGVPLAIVVMNDSAYGSERVVLETAGLDPSHANIPEVNFAGIARALGITAARVHTLAGLEPLLEQLASPSGPLLIDVVVRQDRTPPMTVLD